MPPEGTELLILTLELEAAVDSQNWSSVQMLLDRRSDVIAHYEQTKRPISADIKAKALAADQRINEKLRVGMRSVAASLEKVEVGRTARRAYQMASC